MGLFVTKIMDAFDWFRNIPARVLILGIDGAGKTTILYRMKLNEAVSVIPTVGFNVETVSPCKGLTITVWDVGGGNKIRPLIRHHYLKNSDGLVYVVDSNDRERFQETREELHAILECEEIKGVPLLVFANKKDLQHAEPLPKVTEALGLSNLTRQWHIQASCAVNGDGIVDGMQQFSQMIKNFKKTRNNL